MAFASRVAQLCFCIAALFAAILVGPSQLKGQDVNGGNAPSSVGLIAYPLEPPRTDSPRATLQSFLKNANIAIKLYRDGAHSTEIRRVFRQALLCLDVSELPAAALSQIGVEKFLLLKEILDRVQIPPVEEIPDKQQVERDELVQWVLPHTEITFSRMDKGPRSGQFLFSASTVASLEEFYELAKGLPYKRNATIGAYEDFIYGPGILIPRTWVEHLPTWMHAVVGHQTIWQWGALVCLLLAAVLATWIVYSLGRRWDEKFINASAWLQFGKPLTAIFVIGLTFLLSTLIDFAINITGSQFVALDLVIFAARYLAIAYFAVVLISRISTGIVHARSLRPASLDSQLIAIVSRLVSILVVVYITVMAAESFGIPVAPLVAGLGVGGLAIALAVRPTLENVVGGLILFADKPVRVGEFCAFGDKIGTVEEIGLRSTRVRTLDETLISIPNAEFSQSTIENYSKRRKVLLRMKIGLRYETGADQMRYCLTKLREMLVGHPKVDGEGLRVRFIDFDDFALSLEIFAYVNCTDWPSFLAIREDINLRIISVIDEAGTGFAFPSQTAYLARDSGINIDIADRASREVDQWRANGRLPFPDFDEETIREIEDQIDYPPRGSSQRQFVSGNGAEPRAQELRTTTSQSNPERRRLSRLWQSASHNDEGVDDRSEQSGITDRLALEEVVDDVSVPTKHRQSEVTLSRDRVTEIAGSGNGSSDIAERQLFDNGIAYLRTNRLSDAENCFTEFLRLYRGSELVGRALYCLSKTLALQGRNRAALETLNFSKSMIGSDDLKFSGKISRLELDLEAKLHDTAKG